jgi:hypothetical protein
MQKHVEPDSEEQRLSLLETITGDDAFYKVQILEAHNIHVVAIADGAGAVTGEGLSLYPECEIYVFEEDLSTTRNILEQPIEQHETYDWEIYKETKKKRVELLAVF